MTPLSTKSAILDAQSEDRFFGSTTAPVRRQLDNQNSHLDAYSVINYVAGFASLIADDIAGLNYQFKRPDDSIANNDKINGLMKFPIPSTSYFEWIKYLTLTYLLHGNAYIWMAKGDALAVSRNKPSDFIPLNPNDVQTVTKYGQSITGTTKTSEYEIGHYLVTIGARQFTVYPHEMIHIKMIGPFNVLVGLGIVGQNVNILEADRFASILNQAFFANAAQPSMIVSPDGALDPLPSVIEGLKRDFNGNYSGYRNWGKVIFPKFKAKIDQIQPIKMTDAQFIESKKMTREDIAAMFRIPPVISQLWSDAKYDSAGEQKRIYWNTTVKRHVLNLSHGLSDLISQFDASLKFDFIIPNMVTESELKEMFDRGVVNGNEYRQLAGLSKLESEHLDNFFQVANYLPAGETNPVTALERPSAGDKKDLPIAVCKATSLQWMIHRVAIKSRAKLEPSVEREVIAYYKGLESRINDAFSAVDKAGVVLSTKSLLDDIFSLDSEVSLAMAASKRFFTSIVVNAINDQNEIVGRQVDASTKNRGLVLVVEKLAKRYADQTLNTRREELRSLIKTGIDEGIPLSEIKSRISDSFEALRGNESAWKAARIARTETAAAYEDGSKMVYESLGVKSVRVIGCVDPGPPWDCDADGSRGPHLIGKTLRFKPNHTGTVVPDITDRAFVNYVERGEYES